MLLDDDEVEDVDTPLEPVLVLPPEVEPPKDEEPLVLDVEEPVEVEDDPPAELELETSPDVVPPVEPLPPELVEVDELDVLLVDCAAAGASAMTLAALRPMTRVQAHNWRWP